MNTKLFIVAGLLTCLLNSAANAQSSPQDLRDSHREGKTVLIKSWCKYGSIKLSQDKNTGVIAGVVVNNGTDDKRHEFPITLTLPIDHAGDIRWISDTRFLVSGLKDTGPLGMLFLVEISPVAGGYSLSNLKSGAYSLSGTPTGFDLTDLSYQHTDGRLYGVDYKGKRVVSAPWTDQVIAQDLPALASWETVMAFDANYLGIMSNVSVKSYPGGVYVYNAAGAYIGNYSRQLGLWNEIPDEPQVATAISVLNVKQSSTMGGLVVRGPDGMFEIRRADTDESVYVGMIIDNEATVTFAAPGIIPGLQHVAIGPAGARSTFRVPVRYGTCVPVGDMKLDAMDLWLAAFSPGSKMAAVGSGLKLSDDLATDTTVQVALWIGLRDANGNDPVTTIDGISYLTSPIAIIDQPTLVRARGFRKSILGERFTIPSAGAEGNVMLFQYVAIDPGGQGVALSDIAGVKVMAASPAPANTASTQTSKTYAVNQTVSKPTRDAYNTAKSWLGSLHGVSKSKSYASVVDLLKKTIKARKGLSGK